MISVDNRIMGGVPCIAGSRIPVTTVVRRLGQSGSIDEVLADYPTLTRDDVLAALRFAADIVDAKQGEESRPTQNAGK